MKSSFIISTKGDSDIINITEKIQEILKKSKIKSGIINVFLMHTTAALTIGENEKGVLEDLKETMKKIIPKNTKYNHNILKNDDNAHSHIRSSIIGNSLCIPFENNQLSLGTWQNIILIDFDTKPREREVIVTVIGDM